MIAPYDRNGKSYDSTRRADPHLTDRLLAHLRPMPSKQHIDVACGTGNYTVALAATGVEMIGTDVSAKMIAAARAKSAAVARDRQSPRWLVADVAALPFGTNTFAGATCTLAIHHFADLGAAFTEVGRVVCAGGRFVILTARPDQMNRYWLFRYFPEMMARAAAQMPNLGATAAALSAAGFVRVATEPYTVRPDVQDLFLYSGKHRPMLYLDPIVRANISSFANLAREGEIAEGCERLVHDIETGYVDRVIAEAEHEGGDYLFVIAER